MRYQVTIGHASVEVEADNLREALSKGKTALCDEWPRFYDVIMAKPDNAFKIEEVK